MKLIVLTFVASMATEAVAYRHNAHQDAHRSLRRRAPTRVEKREPDVVTQCVATVIETVYELEGQQIPNEEAIEGLDDGSYTTIGQTTPGADTSVRTGAGFHEEQTSSESEPEPTPETTGSDSGDSDDSQGDYSNGGTGLEAKFESGKLSCSEFPSDYGAVAVDYLGFGGWCGVQRTPDYSDGDSSIGYIETAVKGQGCTPNSFCSYACPPGYQKTQWPKAQGATLESIGGLYCNAKGKLELTRKDHSTLCSPGVEGIYIQNDLDDVVSTCRTDYPGTEAMTIPTVTKAGQKQPLTNPYSPDYYSWDGKDTTAQYYVNKKGVPAEEACVWDSDEDHDERGNWAPVNIGTGKNKDGITYLSIFPNRPTSNAQLDFNIEIKGDISDECALVDGKYTGGGDGCTVSIPDGGSATIRYYK
ncbi:hypothetical protein VUR80DRAFT_7796 [Thermomyces stellatus]